MCGLMLMFELGLGSFSLKVELIFLKYKCTCLLIFNAFYFSAVF